MKLIITKGATSVSVDVFIRDSSVSTGVGLTGLVFNTASLTAYYTRQNAAATAITLATQTATGAFSSGGFVAVDGTNMPGLYRLDIPDAVLATGVNTAYLMLRGATNMEPCVIELELATIDLQAARVDANVTQLLGTAWLTPATAGTPDVNAKLIGATAQTGRDIGAAVPAATAGAAGGLMIAGSNAATTLATLTVTGATTLTGAVSGTNASNDIRLGATERGLARDKVIERTSLRGTIGSGSTTTSVVTSAMIPATSVSGQLLGQILQFDFDTATAALRGQKTDITASSAIATPTLTVTALTTAPASGDTFTIS